MTAVHVARVNDTGGNLASTWHGTISLHRILHGMTQKNKISREITTNHLYYPGIPLMELLHQQQVTGERIRDIGGMVEAS